MIFVTLVLDAFKSLATKRRVISVSVIMPAKLPSAPTTIDAELRLFASICATVRTLSCAFDTNGFLGRSLKTVL